MFEISGIYAIDRTSIPAMVFLSSIFIFGFHVLPPSSERMNVAVGIRFETVLVLLVPQPDKKLLPLNWQY